MKVLRDLMDIQKKGRKTRTGHFMIMISMVMLMVAMLCQPVQAQNDLCVPNIGGLAGLPDVTDGIVTEDGGWNGATLINLSADLGTTRSAEMQLGKTNTDFYLSLVVDAPVPGADNHIVLVFSTDGNPTNDWRIHIKPFDVGIVNGSGQVPNVITYWRDSNAWNGGAGGTTAAPGFWLHDNTRFNKDALKWELEMRIPRENNSANASSNNAVYFPTGNTAADEWKFYANVLSTSIISGTFTQDPWPTGNIITAGGSLFLTRNTPVNSEWGTVSLFTRVACSGISLERSNIGVQDPNNASNIINSMRRYNPGGAFPEPDMASCDALADNHLWPGTKGPNNIFVAKPLNGMATNKPVSAEFRIANWGIPGSNDWQPIGSVGGGLGVSNNPTTEVVINASTTGTLTANWELSYKQSCLYSYRAHQCIQVNLSSTDGSAVFLNKSVQRNMNFVPASVFKQDARISGRGYEKPKSGSGILEFVLAVDTEVIKYNPETPKIENTIKKRQKWSNNQWNFQEWLKGDWTKAKAYLYRLMKIYGWYPGKNKEALSFVTRGYLKTGNYLILNERNEKKYEYAKGVGGFGHVAVHEGSVQQWLQQLQGESLKKLGKDLYLIRVKPGEDAVVRTTIEAVEGDNRILPGPRRLKGLALVIRGGVAIANGTYSNLFDPGLSGHLGLEYIFTNQFSIEAIFGYHRFANMLTGLDDLNVIQGSLNARLYFMPGPLRIFVNAGGGVYKFDPGDSKMGFNGGGGLQFQLNQRFSLEAAFNYHTVNTTVNFKFTTIQGGFRIKL